MLSLGRDKEQEQEWYKIFKEIEFVGRRIKKFEVAQKRVRPGGKKQKAKMLY